MISEAMDYTDSALISACEMTVTQDWIDTNNHVNVAYYVVAFDVATGVFLDRIGLGERKIESRKTSTFTAEMNVSYVREIRLGDSISMTTQLIGFDAKRVHYYHRMHQSNDGFLAATSECLSLHVSMETRRVMPFLHPTMDSLKDLADSQANLPTPGNIGRKFAARPANNASH